VKFNDPLDDAAIRSLLDWEQGNPSAAACPHGRPIRLRVPLSELERRFQRKD
jgi:DNA mismatch repair ATPase MutL